MLLSILFAAISAVSLLAAPKSEKAGVILTRVVPDYGDLTSGYAVNHTRVKMVVDTDGIPLSVEASEGLPDNVVEALGNWRYQPWTKGMFAVEMTVAVRKKIDHALEQT